MIKRKDIVFVILLPFMIAGCIQTVGIAPLEKREVIVKCILMNDATPMVELYYSGAIGDGRFDPVEDARVMISTKAGSIYQLEHEKEGRYLGDFHSNPGQTYHLTVLVPGRDTISATTTMPEIFEMNTAFYPPEEWLEDSERLWNDLFIPEQSTPDWPVYDWQEYDRIYPWRCIKDDKAIEAMRSEGGPSLMDLMPGMIFSMVSTWPRVLYIVGAREESGEMVHVKHLATNHLLADNANLGGEAWHPDFDAAADTSLRQRFERAVASRYDGLALHDDYLRIVSNGDYDNGLGMVYRLVDKDKTSSYERLFDASSYFTVVGDFSYHYWGEDKEGPRSSVFFCSVSEEYDLYLQDCHRQMAAMEGDVLASLYSNATNNYTNINRGFGIFGAMYVLRHDCNMKMHPAMVLPVYYRSDYYEEYPPYPAPLTGL